MTLSNEQGGIQISWILIGEALRDKIDRHRNFSMHNDVQLVNLAASEYRDLYAAASLLMVTNLS